MKSFGGIPNEEDLIPLMQSQQDAVLDAINGAVNDIQDGSSERKVEIVEALNYVLEQSTEHKQDVERDLKETRDGTEALYAALQQLAENLTADAALRHGEVREQLKDMKGYILAIVMGTSISLMLLGTVVLRLMGVLA